MPPKAVVTSALSYVRLLGRGASDWNQEAAAANYLYSPMELDEWQRRIERLSVHTAETYVIAANSRSGKSVVNALQLSTGKKPERAPASRRHAA